MNQNFTLLLNFLVLMIGQFLASEILSDAAKLWRWPPEQTALTLKALLFVQGLLQGALTIVAHRFTPNGSSSPNPDKPKPGDAVDGSGE